jgi:hypothetical protein
MDLLIEVKDSEASFLIELLQRFDFVKVKNANQISELEGLKRSLHEMQEMRSGKRPKPSISELFTDDE